MDAGVEPHIYVAAQLAEERGLGRGRSLTGESWRGEVASPCFERAGSQRGLLTFELRTAEVLQEEFPLFSLYCNQRDGTV